MPIKTRDVSIAIKVLHSGAQQANRPVATVIVLIQEARYSIVATVLRNAHPLAVSRCVKANLVLKGSEHAIAETTELSGGFCGAE